MTDFKRAKKNNKSNYPVDAVDAASFARVEPLITPDLFLSRFLFGIPKVSPLTGEQLTKEMIKDVIIEAANLVEEELGIPIYPITVRERQPYDVDLWREYGYIMLRQKPILAINKWSIQNSAGHDIYTFPSNWIELDATNGRLNLIPSSIGLGGNIVGPLDGEQGGPGPGFLVLLTDSLSLPGYFTIDYTVGFQTNQGVPAVINRLVGLKAAIALFLRLIPLYGYSSQSLGMDGMSQSQSQQVANLLLQTKAAYDQEYADLLGKLRTKYNNNFIMGFI